MNDFWKNEIQVTDKTKLIFISGVSANLLMHVLNIYGLLYGHGRTYKIEDVPGKDIKGDLKKDLFYKAINHFVKNQPQTAGDLIKIYKENGEKKFGKAMEKSWDEFYKNYWESKKEGLQECFNSSIEMYDWENMASRMEHITGNHFESEIYIIGAEAMAESANLVLPNICIGSLKENKKGDLGFFHEGFHLLLKEKWAEDERIKNLVPKEWNHSGMWGPYWQRKFEQAIAVSLDSLMRNKEDVSGYFRGCNVGDLEEIFFPSIKKWFYEKENNQTNKRLVDLIYEILVENRKEVIDKFVK